MDTDEEDTRYQLVDDLAIVLDKDFRYNRNFFHSESRPDAPNPFLNITDIGLISLPLSETDAKRIIVCAAQAPFCLGTSTVVNKNVIDTWQIDSSLIGIQNPAWESFLKSNVANISSGLELPNGYDIRYKLHKLLLYETGSHFRPYQDTQKEDGMFATMVIILPSQYTGGEIVVSHCSVSKVIDVSATCMSSINVLAWYTDVKHEVKPIRSGYRLVLSYNLMRCSGSDIMPATINTSELSRLYEILERWSTGGYKQIPEQRTVALVLEHQHQYSFLDLNQLKGQDAHKVAQISSIAEMLGFELWLARYEREIVKVRACRLGDSCKLDFLTDLKGSRVTAGSFNKFDNRCIIMGQPHDMGKHDYEDFYKGYGPATVKHSHYHRAALVIFRKEDKDRVMIIVKGVGHGLDTLDNFLNPENPTHEDRKIFDLLLEYNTTSDMSTWNRMVKFPLKWHDLDLWKRTIKCLINCSSSTPDMLTMEIFLAWDLFGFQQVQWSYETIFTKWRQEPSTKINFIHKIKARASDLNKQEAIAWCKQQIVFLVDEGGHQLPEILSIAKEDGMKFLKHCNRVGSNFRFCRTIELLMSEKESICASPANQPGNNGGDDINQIFEDFLDVCIQSCMYSVGEYIGCSFLPASQGYFYLILDVVELCVTTNRADRCVTLFGAIWNIEDNPVGALLDFHIPLVHRLHTCLQNLGSSLLSPPFACFARTVIGYYLSQRLGSRTHIPRSSAQIPTCSRPNCKTCAGILEFLGQVYLPRRDFCISRKTRNHFLQILRAIMNQNPGSISFTEVTKYRYRVNKLQKLLNSYRWEHRLKQARDLLRSIGDDDFIEQLMGDQFEELKEALEGNRSYNYSNTLPKCKPENKMRKD